jgi:hypothetical protein
MPADVKRLTVRVPPAFSTKVAPAVSEMVMVTGNPDEEDAEYELREVKRYLKEGGATVAVVRVNFPVELTLDVVMLWATLLTVKVCWTPAAA